MIHFYAFAIVHACAVALICLNSSTARAAEPQEIVALCRDGHLQLRSEIRQLSCTMEIRIAAKTLSNPYTGKVQKMPAETQHISWWEDQDVVKCIQTLPGSPPIVLEYLWKEGTLKHLKTTGSATPVGRLEGPDGLKHVPTAWRSALFFRPDEFRDAMSPAKVISAVEITEAGRRFYKITSNVSSVFREDLFFDPRRNYAMVKRVGYPKPPDSSSFFVTEVASFTEPKPGIYFPEKVNASHVSNGKSEHQMTTFFSNVKINEEIDPNKLQLRFPPATQVSDTRSGKAYVVDDNEQPTGPQEPIAKKYDLAGDMQYPTAMQPKTPWVKIIAGLAAGVLVLALTALVIRRRMRRCNAAQQRKVDEIRG